jgi:hypothetical protein
LNPLAMPKDGSKFVVMPTKVVKPVWAAYGHLPWAQEAIATYYREKYKDVIVWARDMIKTMDGTAHVRSSLSSIHLVY